jgi:hypothetical protein
LPVDVEVLALQLSGAPLEPGGAAGDCLACHQLLGHSQPVLCLLERLGVEGGQDAICHTLQGFQGF